MIETFELCQRVRQVAGAKRFASAVGRTVNHVYLWMRDPNDPEANGATNVFDWIEAIIDLLASRPDGRPVLIQIREWFDALMDRALGAWAPCPVSPEAWTEETATMLHEFADFVTECAEQPGADGCFTAERRAKLHKEGGELIAKVEGMLRYAADPIDKPKHLKAS